MINERAVTWQDGDLLAPAPPVVAGRPFLGSALDLRQKPLQFLVEQYRKMGPVFTVHALHRRFTVLAGPEANLFMTRAGDQYLSGRDSWDTFAREVDAQYFLAAIDGPVHARLRKVIKEPYSRHQIMRQTADTVEITRDVIAEWPEDRALVVFPLMQQLVSEQIGRLLLGEGPGAYFPDFVVFMRTLLNAVLGQWPKFMLRMPRYRRAKRRVMALAAHMIDTHRRLGDAADPNLITHLLAGAEENPDILTESELLLGALGPYLAGIDTVAGTLSFMVYALLKEPGLKDALQAEVDGVFGAGELSKASLKDLPLLKAALIETMRMYPVAPMLPRTVINPFTFAGYQLSVGEPVMLAIGVAHYDSALYPEPDRFDVDRHMAPRHEHRQPGAFAPYGLGAHTCAGAGFAEVELLLTLATLLRTVDVSLVNPAYQLRLKADPSIAPDDQFRVSFRRRA